MDLWPKLMRAVSGEYDKITSFTSCKMNGTVRVIKIGRLRCLGHLFRMQELDPCRQLTLHKPEGTRRVGQPTARWLESVETDLKKTGVKNWRRKAQDREQWRTILKEAKVHQGQRRRRRRRQQQQQQQRRRREGEGGEGEGEGERGGGEAEDEGGEGEGGEEEDKKEEEKEEEEKNNENEKEKKEKEEKEKEKEEEKEKKNGKKLETIRGTVCKTKINHHVTGV
jgi:hypothetical protein